MSYAEPEIVVDFAADEEVIPLTPQQGNHVDPLSSGFLWYTPPMAATPELHHDSGSTWSIGGHDFQVLAMTLPPGGQIITEVGTFMFGSPDIKTNVELTLCRQSGIMEGCRRILGGESCVKVVLVNPTSDGYVGITPNFPAKIMPIQVRSFFLKKNIFLCVSMILSSSSSNYSSHCLCCVSFFLSSQKSLENIYHKINILLDNVVHICRILVM